MKMVRISKTHHTGESPCPESVKLKCMDSGFQRNSQMQKEVILSEQRVFEMILKVMRNGAFHVQCRVF